MPTGPEHYREAEERLDAIDRILERSTENTYAEDVVHCTMLAGVALTHATLAAAAATAAPVVRGAAYAEHDREWRAVAGVGKDPET